MSKGNKFCLVGGITLVITAFLFISPTILRAETGQDNGTIYVAENETVNENYYKAGRSLILDGTFYGDVIVAGENVEINGDVYGDIIAAARTIEVNGEVTGNIRVAAETIKINSAVGKNVNAFGNIVTIGDDAQIGWSALFGAAIFKFDGKVMGNIRGGAGEVTVDGWVDGNTNVAVGQGGDFTLGPNAKLQGNLDYTAPQKVVMDEEAEVWGETNYTPLALKDKDKKSAFLGWGYWFGKINALLGLIIVGLIILSLFKNRARKVVDNMIANSGKSMLWGLILLIATPIVAFIIMFTIVGLPLALIVSALYMVALYLTKIFTALAFGFIFWKFLLKKDLKDINIMWLLVIGVVIFIILTSIPFLGWLIGLVSAIWALGAMIPLRKKEIKAKS